MVRGVIFFISEKSLRWKERVLKDGAGQGMGTGVRAHIMNAP